MSKDKEKVLVAERAAEWLRRLETAGPEERAEFWEWVTESPSHVREVLVAKACDITLLHLMRDRRIDTGAVMGRSGNVHPIEGHRLTNDAADTPLAIPASPRRHPIAGLATARRRTWTVAAAFSFMVLATLIAVAIRPVSDRNVVTASGHWRTTQLPDGSLLHAGPRTKVSITFTGHQRIVHLTRGEVMLHVAKDRARPFLVDADLATARAVGTAFAVSRVDPGKVVVTVKEGVVEVARSAHGRTDRVAASRADEHVILRAGEQVRVAGAVPLAVVSIDVRKELSWVNGWLVFDEETLAQAARQFNMRNELQIRILDSAIAKQAVRGAFEAASPEKFAAFLERQGIVSVVNDEHGTLLLVPYQGRANKRLIEPPTF